MKKDGNWRDGQVEFLLANVGRMPLDKIADALGKTEEAVRLYLFRHKIPVRPRVKSPTVVRLLEIKFGDSKWFSPTRDFYQRVGIGQRRWNEMAFGYANPTEDELRRIVSVFNLCEDEWVKLLDASQLKLFD